MRADLRETSRVVQTDPESLTVGESAWPCGKTLGW